MNLEEHADARRTEEQNAGQVEFDRVAAATEFLGHGVAQFAGALGVEATRDDERHGLAEVLSFDRDIHGWATARGRGTVKRQVEHPRRHRANRRGGDAADSVGRRRRSVAPEGEERQRPASAITSASATSGITTVTIPMSA
jgi:hypothetical protein